jgi:hypothetical protein
MGGSSTEQIDQRYESLESLYAEQAESARLLRNLAEANLPTATNNYMRAVQEITSPDYATKQAQLALEDVTSANARQRAATDFNLQSMGVNPADARYVAANRATQLSNAAREAAAQNIARNEAADKQLAVAQDAVGTFTGQSNSAASQLSGASSGLASLYNNMASQQQTQSSNTANNIGSAVGGAAALYSLFGGNKGGKVPEGLEQLACGGKVKHLAGGGFAASANQTQQGFFPIQTVTPPTYARPQQPQQQQQQQNPIQQAQQTYKQVKNAGEMVMDKFIAPGSKEAMQSGAQMTAEQAQAASQAYRTAAQEANGLQSLEYSRIADKIDAGFKAANPGATPTTAAPTAAPTTAAPALGAEAAPTAAAAPELAGVEAGTIMPGAAPIPAAPTLGAEVAGTTASNLASGVGSGVAGAGAGAGSAAASLMAVEGGTTALSAAGTGATMGSAAGPVGTAIGAIAGAVIGLLAGGVNKGGKVGKAGKPHGKQHHGKQHGEQHGEQHGKRHDGVSLAAFSPSPSPDLQDYRETGGQVAGEWTPPADQDTVPAMLKPEEHVLNAEAAKLVGERDLDALNAIGLKARAKGETPDTLPTVGLAQLLG